MFKTTQKDIKRRHKCLLSHIARFYTIAASAVIFGIRRAMTHVRFGPITSGLQATAHGSKKNAISPFGIWWNAKKTDPDTMHDMQQLHMGARAVLYSKIGRYAKKTTCSKHIKKHPSRLHMMFKRCFESFGGMLHHVANQHFGFWRGGALAVLHSGNGDTPAHVSPHSGQHNMRRANNFYTDIS